MNANRSRSLLLAALMVLPLAYVVLAMIGGWSFGRLTGASALLAVAIVFCAWLLGLWLFQRSTEQQRDNWRQVRLSNVLVSMALFGATAALAKVYLHPPHRSAAPLYLVSTITFLGGAVGGIFGRVKRGMLFMAPIGIALLLAEALIDLPAPRHGLIDATPATVLLTFGICVLVGANVGAAFRHVAYGGVAGFLIFGCLVIASALFAG